MSKSETPFLSQRKAVSLIAKRRFSESNAPGWYNMGLRLALDDITSRPQRDYGSCHTTLRLVVSLLLMLVVGLNGVWGQPFTVTTDTSNPVYYLIQNLGTPSFYAVPYSNDDETTTTTANVPNSDMRFYFVSVKNEEGYYYIIHCSGKYLYAMGDANADGGARLKESSTLPTDNRYKFQIVQNGGGYYIINKQLGSEAPLCKRGGNTYIGYQDENTPNYFFLKLNTYLDKNGKRDDYFRWNFIPISGNTSITWTAPFTLSTEDNYYFYKIKNSVNTSFYISRNSSTNKVNTSSTASDDMTWIFEEVPVGESGSDQYITYYYIIHALTGKYMCFDANPSNYTANQDNAVSVQTKTGSNEQNCQFIITRSSQRDVTTYYNIIPKALKDYIWNNQSIGQKDAKAGTNVRTATDRTGNTNSARWIFETTTFDVAWSDPVITCNLDGDITITNEEDNAAFYYTTNGTTPTKESSKYDASNKPKVNAGITTIMVRAIGGTRQPSNVVTKTIVYNPTITLTADSYTYTGVVQSPISSVSVGTTPIAVSEYNAIYKKNDAVAEFKDAGNYTIELTDADGGDYIVAGSTSVSIGQAALTITAKSHAITYGDAPSNGGVTPTGFVNNETIDVLSGTLSYTYNYTQFGDVGSYTITPSGLTSTNYNITYATGILTVNPKEIGLNWNATSFPYNGQAQTPIATAIGLVNSDEIGVTTSVTGEHTNAGSYTVTATALTGAKVGNYKLPEAKTQDFTISPKDITVTAAAKSKTYGDDDPELTYTSAGLLGTDVVTGSLSRVEGENAGTYAITQGMVTAGNNYSIIYTGANLTINPKALTVVALAQSKTYGDDDPALTYTSAGLIGSDAISGSLSRVAGENVGTYAINQGTLTAGNNYAISYTGANLTISVKTLAISAEAQSKTFGDADPTLTYTSEGLVGNDAISGLLSRADGENVGIYSINQGTLTAGGNYQITYTGANLTISPRSIGDGTTPASGITVNLSKVGDNYTITVKYGETTLNDNTDYTVSEPVVDEDGIKTWTITGTGNYKDAARAMYQTVQFWATGENTEGLKNVAPYKTEKANLAQPAGMKPYIVSGINMTKHVLHLKALDYIPKDVPVLMLADELATPEATDFTTSPKYVQDEEDTSRNQLKVSEGQHVETGQVYAFYKGRFVLTSSGTLKVGKFYLDNPNYQATSSGGSTDAPLLRIVIDDATGIDRMLSEESVDTQDIWYSVDGRRLNGLPVDKGIYIKNGRKIVIR